MPHIKSIRLVNVHFNNATQFYDDFSMELGGRNTTYDLENGGGKSLLLLMVLQTVLPKSYLRREKPLSLLFQGGKDRTSHVAVEWILEEGSGYKYLLTGFSARKRRGTAEPAGTNGSEEEENLQAVDIEHLNWCVFYNDNRITGIKSVPLFAEEAGKKSYAGFEDIRKYIQLIRQKGLPAEVFDKIDKYQSYISVHHLLSAEWNIIKGINSGENNIESYFRQNATSRKLIENQFVKIVEDVEALNKGEKNNDDSFLLADTLIEIRNRLNEYLRLKGHMTEFEKIKEYYEEFGKRNEEFLKAYQEYEACKMLAAAIHKLIKNKLKTLEEKKTETKAKLDYNTDGSIEGQQLKRLLEAGLVNHEKERLFAVLQHLEAERDQLAARQSELEKRLNRLLTLEGYGEYRKVKAKVREIRQRLQTLETDEDSLKADYRKAGGKLRFLTDKLFQELEGEQKKAKTTKDELEKENDKAQQERIENEKIASELGVKIKDLIQQETHLQDKLKGLNDFFLKHGEMDAVLAPEQFLSRLEEERSRYLSEHDSIIERIKSIDYELQNLGLAVVKTEGEINSKQETKKTLESWLEDCQLELSGLEKKAAGFGKSTVEEYKEGLQLLIHKESLSKLEKEIEAGRMRQKKQLSEDRGYYVPNEEILSLAGQLSSKCEFVQTGIDWIAQAEPEEKENILRQMPYLPFSVIIDRGSFDKLKNGRLKPDFSSDYPVPVVNLETVRLMNDSNREDIYYFCGFTGLLLDSGRYNQYIQSMEAALKKLDKEIITTDTRINELNRDLSGVDVFYGKYPQAEIENKKKMVKTIKDDITIFQERLHELNEKKNNFLKERKVLNGRLEELAKLTAECQEKIEKLVDSRETGNNLAGIRVQLGLKQKELEAVQEKIAKIKADIANLKQQYDSVVERLDGLRLEVHDVKKDKEQLFSFTEVENTLAITQVRAEYKALQEAMSGRNAEESELRSNLEDNETRLDALKDRILRDYGEDLEEVEKGEEKGLQIIIPTQSMIKEVKQNKDANSKKLKAANERVTEISLAIQKTEGKLEEILKDSGEDLEADLPRYDSESRYQQEIEQAEQLIKSYAEEINRANEELERIKEEYSRLNNQKEDYEAFLEREEVTDDGTVAPETKEYRQFEKEYRRLQDIIRLQSEKWDDRMKTIQAENVQFVIREPLEELGKISKPVSTAQCLARKENFIEYIANIEEQMQKIIRDIRQLESYQEDFTRRCIQRAELVLGHLRKLESLSRIEVYGRRTNMIELKLQEFEEKDKQLRMKAHIDGIVREIGEEGDVDRKRVAAKLSTKELLAQIVNMDKAAVRLYKIESIPENSRFYRWENAIGSEGQNNSLYFIFAACLISFIRMLSITNTSVRTKKVIIADNPFGATSAVYLWDPMFKIMKQNDIQLIAPGHRIPREITSRFGVSYLLNQDILQDGRMRVVIKDVRVEEDEEVLRYIDSEQLSLF
ncbi:hypothetical protein BR63_16750 [Thermanaerosceptrum fracticalcis]|uniref:Chromosome segregation ATPase n=1 Tax=Thermanaerosceptrum fracticalcis TaxID=1712410 RepID=A0A7G6E6S1_THEFR|nr:hypothetical protein [Thermanaerosceptrum fracticalcis]QNB47775.1 hypothetical protein BR63_16750 [Thermanaerosceptrum fracticalcis]